MRNIYKFNLERSFKHLIFILFILSPATIAKADDWSGFKVGAHLAYGAQDFDGVFDSGASTPDPLNGFDADDFIVGGHIGYDHLINNFLIGIEGDFSYLDAKDTIELPSLSTFGDFATVNPEYIASIRTRLGVVFNNVLLYGTIGYSWYEADFDVTENLGASSEESGSITLDGEGAVYGGGVEFKLSEKISAGIEYLHYDIGETRSIANDELPDADTGDFIKIDDIDVVRARLSFKLN